MKGVLPTGLRAVVLAGQANPNNFSYLISASELQFERVPIGSNRFANTEDAMNCKLDSRFGSLEVLNFGLDLEFSSGKFKFV